MRSGHKHGRISAPRHRWQDKFKPHRLNEQWPFMKVIRVKPEPGKLPIVEVRITRTRLRMYAAMWRDGQCVQGTMWTMGLCRSFRKKIEAGFSRETPRRPRLDWLHSVARIYLNSQDLRFHSSDTIAHECGHAAMAYARYRHADLSTVAGEETMAYALGRLVQAVNNRLHARRAYRT